MGPSTPPGDAGQEVDEGSHTNGEGAASAGTGAEPSQRHEGVSVASAPTAPLGPDILGSKSNQGEGTGDRVEMNGTAPNSAAVTEDVQEAQVIAADATVETLDSGKYRPPTTAAGHIQQQTDKRESVNSFATAPETQNAYRNSTASSLSLAGPSTGMGSPMTRRDTAGSLSAMARIAEAAEDTAQTQPNTATSTSADKGIMGVPIVEEHRSGITQGPTSQPPISTSSSSATPTPKPQNGFGDSAQADQLRPLHDIKTVNKRQSMSSVGSGSTGSRRSASRKDLGEGVTDLDDRGSSSTSISRRSSNAFQPSGSVSRGSSMGNGSKRISSFHAPDSSPPVPQLAGNSASPRIASPSEKYRTTIRQQQHPQEQSPTPYQDGLFAPPVQRVRSLGSESANAGGAAAGSQSYHRNNRSRDAIPPVPLPGSNFTYAGGNQSFEAVSAALPAGAVGQRISQAPGNRYMQQPQRSSVVSHHLPASASGQYLPYQHNSQYDSIYSTSPHHLSDAGFGSSSPYPPMSLPPQQYNQSGPISQHLAHSPSKSSGGLYGQAPYGNQQSLPAVALRPQPTTAYASLPGQSRHLPEMHPSALEARPSVSAPFPPSSSPPRGGPSHIAAPAAVQQQQRVDAQRPLGQEICLECLMRDRDMADVEVTGPGVWSRSSDLDFEEALRTEELLIANARNANGSGMNSSQEGSMHGSMRNGGNSTEDSHNKAYPGNAGGHQMRSPSRDSSLSDSYGRPAGASQKRYTLPKRKYGGGQPLTEASLKLWTSMNQPASSHRFRTLQDFVAEQTRYLAMERYAAQQSLLERERADQLLRDTPTPSGFGDGQAKLPASPITSVHTRASSDTRGRVNDKKGRSSQLLPNGMTIETIDVGKDEKEAKKRVKASAKARRMSSHSPEDSRRTSRGKSNKGAPSIRSFNASSFAADATSGPYIDNHTSPIMPWLSDQRRRFSSPMLSMSKNQHSSSENLGRSRGGYGDSQTDLRMSTQSMMQAPRSANTFRSPSPSRASVGTGKTRDSRMWGRGLWNRSASASVLSFAHSGSMMEMHLGMSQDKHAPNNQYADDLYRDATGQLQAGRTWPDTSSVIDDSGGGISPDENVDGVLNNPRKKKKGFKKFLNSMFTTKKDVRNSRQSAVEGDATFDSASPVPRNMASGPPGGRERVSVASGTRGNGKARPEQGRRESSLSYAAARGAIHDDYSEPLAPPPSLSFLTGQKPHSRSFSSSSQSSSSPVLGPAEQAGLFFKDGRPNSLAVPVSAGISSAAAMTVSNSSGMISPYTSSSDLNRPRPDSVTSWRSSSNKGSPQSPRELAAEAFQPQVAIASPSDRAEEVAPSFAQSPPIGHIADPDASNLNKLRKDKSLPALPLSEGDDWRLHQADVPIETPLQKLPWSQHQNYQSTWPPASTVPAQYQLVNRATSSALGYASQPQTQHAAEQAPGFSSPVPLSMRYSPESYEFIQGPEHDPIINDGSKKSRKSKSKSKLFGFGGGRKSSSHDDYLSAGSGSRQAEAAGSPPAAPPTGYAPHEAALNAIVRDNPTEMVAYRYPSVTH